MNALQKIFATVLALFLAAIGAAVAAYLVPRDHLSSSRADRHGIRRKSRTIPRN